MEYYSVLLPLAAILFSSKVLVKVCQKIHLPGVVGMLTAGVLVGLIRYIPDQRFLTAEAVEGLGFIAKIGVILIMFSAGLETKIKQVKEVGTPAVFITAADVVVPMGLGFLVAAMFNGGLVGVSGDVLLNDLFYGIILTAASVSVTIATLKELGKLTGKVGSTILAAAILDDIIGIVVLSFIIGIRKQDNNGGSPLRVLWMTLLFFIAVIVFGWIIRRIFRVLDARFPHHRLIPVFSLALCFFFAYASEHFFGVADITGAFFAGMILSEMPDTDYVDRRSDIISYLIFTPVFFANIGITSDFSGISTGLAFFGLALIAAGMIGKVAGCGLTARLCGYSAKESLRVGLGMMARAEVALVCAQKGVEHGMIDDGIMPFIVLLIVITSFVTPVLLKTTYRKKSSAEAK